MAKARLQLTRCKRNKLRRWRQGGGNRCAKAQDNSGRRHSKISAALAAALKLKMTNDKGTIAIISLRLHVCTCVLIPGWKFMDIEKVIRLVGCVRLGSATGTSSVLSK